MSKIFLTLAVTLSTALCAFDDSPLSLSSELGFEEHDAFLPPSEDEILTPEIATLEDEEEQQMEALEQLVEYSIAEEEQEPAPEPIVDEAQDAEVILTSDSTPEPIAESRPIVIPAPSEKTLEVSFFQAFKGAPLIYTVLILLSMATCFIAFYNYLKLRRYSNTPETLMNEIRENIAKKEYENAKKLCDNNAFYFCKMMSTALETREHGIQAAKESMDAEGRRITLSLWQKVAILGDIAVIAPMLGLLGTVLGMFYAFYDINRSMESVSTLFDGLGVSVGTTVAGLLVAIIALILQSLTKQKLVKTFSKIEHSSHSMVTNICGKEESRV